MRTIIESLVPAFPGAHVPIELAVRNRDRELHQLQSRPDSLVRAAHNRPVVEVSQSRSITLRQTIERLLPTSLPYLAT